MRALFLVLVLGACGDNVSEPSAPDAAPAPMIDAMPTCEVLCGTQRLVCTSEHDCACYTAPGVLTACYRDHY